MPGSRSPARLLITTPPAGVSPMLVSTQRPSIKAARLAPPPKCGQYHPTASLVAAQVLQRREKERVRQAGGSRIGAARRWEVTGSVRLIAGQIVVKRSVETGDVRKRPA